ncbi:mannose-1-phosphate guanylyltransferase [Neolewinella agarilytica]|uniref:mannose-1-phosphate guanylyltransferase n=1 Tax=Neolewinella agarilytica TaxID=478744 RepID=A0A1H9NVM1_9BACT|nr:mannose-1-phosphate guanylyltransferase [Neolewinella agarilytica]SER40036.1 mannose-1-phosphate guanylyltransferase [Neolewinella agarilytica]
MSNHTYIAIMAGGVGSRFWPASREARPKQFLDITGDGRSLLRITFERFLRVTTADKIFIVTNGKYQQQVMEHIPELEDNQILCEPSRNNTAPCVAYTAFKLHQLDPEANIVIAPSDALIVNESLFADNINKALTYTAENDALLTLGIAPDRPHTGYGYIQFLGEESDNGVYPVKRFTEKPDMETAKSFITSGDYLWNAGIFIWRAKTILEAYEQFAPEIYALLSQGMSCYNTPEEQAFINEFYPQTPKISVDYAIMENARNIHTIPAQFGWSDLGAWGALYNESPKDSSGNVIAGERVITEDVHNSLIRAPKDKLIVVGGVDDLLIIDEGDVLVVYPRSREQEVKALRKRASDSYGEEYV